MGKKKCECRETWVWNADEGVRGVGANGEAAKGGEMNLERAADMLTRAAKEIEKQALPLVSAHDMQRREAIVLALGRIEGVAMMLSGIKDSGRPPERPE